MSAPRTPSEAPLLRSMTGFGRAEAAVDGIRVQAEVKSVNHRFCQVQVRGVRELAAVEPEVEARVRGLVRRGRFDVALDVSRDEGVLAIDRDRAARLAAELKELAGSLDLEGSVGLTHLLAVPGFLDSVPADDGELRACVLEAVDGALGALDESRAREGAALAPTLLARMDTLLAELAEVEVLAPQRTAHFEERLERRMRRILEGRDVDESRLLQEVAVFSERADVAEECDRIRAHAGEVRATVERGGAVGRRLDFLAQELQRECTTLGAKAYAPEISRHVVTMKEEVERLREQVQNVE